MLIPKNIVVTNIFFQIVQEDQLLRKKYTFITNVYLKYFIIKKQYKEFLNHVVTEYMIFYLAYNSSCNT